VVTALHRAATHPKNRSSSERERERKKRASGRASRPLLVLSARQEDGGRMDDEWMTDRQTDRQTDIKFSFATQ
jgi:hypothetical protein